MKQTSKFLSLILRHNPDVIGIKLDPNGWACVDELLAGMKIELPLLKKIVAEDDKQRYSFNEDCTKIRANQGHSVKIDLGLEPSIPPEKLFHGTATRFLESIDQKGLIPGTRQHVHLSSDIETATKVGQRHGKVAVLTVLSGKMHQAGHKFYISENGVWLTDSVPTEYLELPFSQVVKYNLEE